jgi:hypothetical protein
LEELREKQKEGVEAALEAEKAVSTLETGVGRTRRKGKRRTKRKNE